MRKIGILGGTFDPPHIGHLILAQYTLEALGLEQMLFVPAADPPHKIGVTRTPVEYRLAMLEHAVAENTNFKISLVDIERPGPSYSADTVRIIQSQHPDAELYFVMGGDSLRELPTWHRIEEFFQLCKLAVMRRSDEDIYAEMHQDDLPDLAERVVMIDAPLLGIWISSTDVVDRLRLGKTVRYIVPDAVLDYIRQHKIYNEVTR
jgi:nicotinate-nucleotide adenylyltransferase